MPQLIDPSFATDSSSEITLLVQGLKNDGQTTVDLSGPIISAEVDDPTVCSVSIDPAAPAGNQLIVDGLAPGVDVRVVVTAPCDFGDGVKPHTNAFKMTVTLHPDGHLVFSQVGGNVPRP